MFAHGMAVSLFTLYFHAHRTQNAQKLGKGEVKT